MTAYRYTAYTADGRKRLGTLVADDVAEVTSRLKSEGLFATDIAPETIRVNVGGPGGLRWRRGVTADERAIFTRQLAALISADLSVDAALRMVGASGSTKRIEATCALARASLADGQTLSEALAQSGAGFPPFYLAAIGAGERSGGLDEVLDRLATYLEEGRENRARLASALIYPGFVAAVSLLLCVFLVTTVAPQITGLFETSGRPLPGVTVVLLGTVDWLSRFGLVAVGLAAAAMLAGAVSLRHPGVRDRWRTLPYRLPLIGRLRRLGTAADYLRTLALLISSRQAVDLSVRAAAGVLHTQGHAQQAEAVHQAVLRGERLSDALRHMSLIPDVCIQLVVAGEASSRTAAMTERAATLIEGWLASDTKRIATLIEPILMLLVSGFVLTVVLGVLLPIFDLQTVITAP